MQNQISILFTVWQAVRALETVGTMDLLQPGGEVLSCPRVTGMAVVYLWEVPGDAAKFLLNYLDTTLKLAVGKSVFRIEIKIGFICQVAVPVCWIKAPDLCGYQSLSLNV